MDQPACDFDTCMKGFDELDKCIANKTHNNNNCFVSYVQNYFSSCNGLQISVEESSSYDKKAASFKSTPQYNIQATTTDRSKTNTLTRRFKGFEGDHYVRGGPAC